MRSINPFWHTPAHQVADKPQVRFELKPLDQRAYMTLKDDMYMKRGRVLIGADGRIDVFMYAVKNWEGIDVPFSESAKRDLCNGLADVNAELWMKEIAETLFKRAVLGEPELKNS